MPRSSSALRRPDLARLLLLAAALLLLCPAARARADAAPACAEPNVQKALQGAASFKPADLKAWPAVQAISRYTIVPLDASIDVALHAPNGTGLDGSSVATYRVAIQFGRLPAPVAAKAALVEGLSVFARQVGDADPLAKAAVVLGREPLLTLTVPAPAVADKWGHWGWHTGVITVIGCDSAQQPVFVARTPVSFSDRSTCILITLVAVLVLYVLIALAAWSVDEDKRARGFNREMWEHLDPVTLTSGANNRGSISRLQVLFFSLLIASILSYVLIRVGLLSDLSTTVLYLMGISGVGAAAAKATDVSKNRLDFDNWIWLIDKHWLPPFGMAGKVEARWRDLVTADDGFDIYHFQMLLFSLVVGAALLQQGFTGLANFDIPDALLGVLGLSQAVYIGGMQVTPANYKNLNQALDDLRDLETKFYTKATLAPPLRATTPEAKRQEAEDRAYTEYKAFKLKVDAVYAMFKSVFPPLPTRPTDDPVSMEPRYE